MWMKALDKWVPYSDLAELLEKDPTRLVITSDFVLNQLHALIRAPFDFCTTIAKITTRRCRASTLSTLYKSVSLVPIRAFSTKRHLSQLPLRL